MRTNKEELQARKILRYNAHDIKSLSNGQKNKLRRHGLIDFYNVAGITYYFVTEYGKEFLSPNPLVK